MKLFKSSTPSNEDLQGTPHEDHRCMCCGGYVGCDDRPEDRLGRMQAEQVQPQASYPQLACPYCQEVH